MKNKKDYSLIFGLHLIITIIAYLSPFLFSYWIIILGALILQIQFLLINDCFINWFEFGPINEITFVGYYLQKWGLIKENTIKTKIIIRYITPVLVIVFALIWQVLLNQQVFLF